MILSFRSALEAREPVAMRAALHPDVVLHAPVAIAPLRGREAVLAVLDHVTAVMPDLHYVDELTSGDFTHALVFRATVGGTSIDGVDYVRVDADGLVTEVRVFISPATAATALSEAVAERLAAVGSAA